MANDNNIQPMADDSQIVLYQPDESISLQVKIEEDTVWLTQAQMVELFGSSKANISEHITNIYQQGELMQSATVRKFRTVRKEGNRMVTRNMDYYNLDMIISVGFRVNSHQGIRFRQWANNVLKEYLLRGYAVHQQMLQMEQRIDSKLMLQHDEMQRIKDTQVKQQRYQSGKKSFYTHVYMYIVDDTKVTLYADWGDYFLHLDSITQIDHFDGIMKRPCPTFVEILTNDDFEKAGIMSMNGKETMGLGMDVKVDWNGKIKPAALPYYPSVADGIVKLTEKSLKLYTEISKNCPLKLWKDRLVAVWGEETK